MAPSLPQSTLLCALLLLAASPSAMAIDQENLAESATRIGHLSQTVTTLRSTYVFVGYDTTPPEDDGPDRFSDPMRFCWRAGTDARASTEYYECWAHRNQEGSPDQTVQGYPPGEIVLGATIAGKRICAIAIRDGKPHHPCAEQLCAHPNPDRNPLCDPSCARPVLPLMA